MALHENIYRLRAARNMSQGDLAEALEVSRQSISKWECGDGYPDITLLPRIAHHFHITVDELIGNEWLRIPHFYRSFYVYKYATGIVSAVSIAERIEKERI